MVLQIYCTMSEAAIRQWYTWLQTAFAKTGTISSRNDLGSGFGPKWGYHTTKMRNQAIKWADAMRTGKLSRQNAWTAISTTIWRTLSYPLSALNLTRQQCDKIMAPILKYGLPALGIWLGLQLHLISYPDMAQMASNSLVKSTWKFLWDNKVELWHEIELETQWTGDNSLMNSFISLGANREGLLALNRCHLYLQAYFISDLVDGSGE